MPRPKLRTPTGAVDLRQRAIDRRQRAHASDDQRNSRRVPADVRDDAVDNGGVLGVQLVKRGQLEAGLPLLEQGVKADPPERDVAWLRAAPPE